VTVHTLNGRFICQAEHQGDTAFNDTGVAREHAKNKARYRKANKKAADAQQRMTELEVAAQYPQYLDEEDAVPDSGVVGGNFKQKKQVEDGEVVNREKDGPSKDEIAFIGLMSDMKAIIQQREDGRI